MVGGKRGARSSAGVEETRKENEEEAIADTSGSARYGWGEKAWGAQVIDGGKEEYVRRGGIGEGHVDILRCRSEGRGWGSVVSEDGHFELVMLCDTLDRVIGVPRFVTAPNLSTRSLGPSASLLFYYSSTFSFPSTRS